MPAGLFEKMMRRLGEEQRLQSVRRRLVIFSIVFIGSVLALIPTFQMAKTGMAESGLIQFFSLLFSDFGTVINYWQSFVLTILESLPVMSLVAFLAAFFVFLESIKFLAREMKNIKSIIYLTKRLI